jgi:hypothetical protein
LSKGWWVMILAQCMFGQEEEEEEEEEDRRACGAF